MANLQDLIDPEYGLQQDEWSLTRPRFGAEAQVEVIGWSGRSSNKLYILHCSVCKQDPEIFGEGIFRSLKHNLSKGQVPCGCSKKHYYGRHQYEILVKRKIKGSSCTFTSFNLAEPMSMSEVNLRCALHGKLTVKLKSLLHKGVQCKYCSFQRISDLKKGVVPIEAVESTKKSDEYFIQSFRGTNKFVDGTIFTRVNNGKFEVYCPVCDSISISTAGNLKRGHISCKCSVRPTYSKVEMEAWLVSYSTSHTYNFLYWAEDYRGVHTKIYADCKIHGKFKISIDNFKRDRGCPSCSNKNQKQAYINLITDGTEPIALKFGIAVNSDRRRKSQNKSSLFKVRSLKTCIFADTESCKDAERECKQTLECGVLTKEEMPDGYTETTRLHNLDKIISIYEKHGGKRIK